MKKALIVRFSSLGDVALVSVLIDPLIEAGYRPYLLTFEPYNTLFEDDRRVRVIPAKREGFPRRDLIGRLKEERFDLIIDAHRNLRSTILRVFLRGRWVSYRKDTLRRRIAVMFGWFKRPFYVTEGYLEALRKAGVDGRPVPRILVSEERIRKVSSFLPRGDFVAIAPGARYRKKVYPRFGDVADLLRGEGLEVVWVGDGRDSELVHGLPGVNLCGRLSLPDLLAVLKTARLFVGNDSGPLHCARAVGTKAVQIYGGTHPTLGFSLHPWEGSVILKDLPCQPCDLHGKGDCRFGDYRCLDIDPRAVFEVCMKILRENAS
ncbi:MAG: glycosyltransferase family 9 protein [Aquificota bacterium]|nr:glycosyltransferase family 9 protein [Aquificota bacterium]